MPVPPHDKMLIDSDRLGESEHVVRAIRERERAVGGHLPVIALTARSRPEDREHCLAAGMDDYVSTPIRAA
jgi:CheY-like chemotaxis protein